MLLFPFFAAIVWLLAAKFRRTVRGFAIVLLGTALLVGLELGIYMLMSTRLRFVKPEQLLLILVPFSGVIAIVGLFICVLPRTRLAAHHCPHCHYDLLGLDPEGLICPECGLSLEYRCLTCRHDLSGRDPVGLICPECDQPWRGAGSRAVELAAPGAEVHVAADPADVAAKARRYVKERQEAAATRSAPERPSEGGSSAPADGATPGAA